MIVLRVPNSDVPEFVLPAIPPAVVLCGILSRYDVRFPLWLLGHTPIHHGWNAVKWNDVTLDYIVIEPYSGPFNHK